MFADPFFTTWIGLAVLFLVLAIFAARRQNIGLTRQRQAMEVQGRAVETQREVLDTLRKLIALTEEANRQREALRALF
ncbi:MAG: hypothetical protein ACHQAY_10535 [Hyphomicrobiales bacterium]